MNRKNNLQLFNKSELSFILNNRDKWGAKFNNSFDDFLLKKGYSIRKIQSITPTWDIHPRRLQIIENDDEIKITKTKTAQKEDKFQMLLILLTGCFFVVLAFWNILFNKFEINQFLLSCGIIIFALFAIIELYRNRKKIKSKSQEIKELIISRDSKIQFYINKKRIKETEISSITYYWLSYDLFSIQLELRVGEYLSLLIDESENHLELFECAVKIGQFLDKEIIFLNSRSPILGKLKL